MSSRDNTWNVIHLARPDFEQLCDLSTWDASDTIIEFKVNKYEEQIEQILSQVSAGCGHSAFVLVGPRPNNKIHGQCAFDFQYVKIREWMRSIRENIEQMKELIREFSQSFQRSSKTGESELIPSLGIVCASNKMQSLSQLCRRVWNGCDWKICHCAKKWVSAIRGSITWS